MLAANSYLSKWSRWIALALRHRAPNLKVVDLIDFSPSSRSADFLSRINAVFRKHNDTYSIFINDLQSGDLSSTIKNPANKINLEGVVNSKNFLLLSNTEMLANRLEIKYINNIRLYPIDEMTFSLTPDEYADPGSLETLELVQPVHTFKVSEKINREGVTFFDAMSQRLEDVRFELQDIDNKTALIHCNFQDCNQGACIVKINGKEFKRIYITDKKQLNIAVELFFSSPGQADALWDGRVFKSRKMQLSFDTKKTYWRYILISRSDQKNIYDINEVAFDLNGESIKLRDPEKKELVNGVRCLYVTFSDPRPLRINTFNHEILKMKINDSKKWSRSSIRMPIPTYKNVQRIDSRTGYTYSLMYVYI